MVLGLSAAAVAQIPTSPSTVDGRYINSGMTDQPFTIEVTDARRTVSNSLQVRMVLTNRGNAPMAVTNDFAAPTDAREAGKISAAYIVDPNGRTRLPVLQDAAGSTLCSRIDPALQPGERRQLNAQFGAPPDTTSSFDLYFPKAQPILNVPIGLPASGEQNPPGAAIGNPGGVPTPANPIQPGPSSAIDQPNNNIRPDVYTNQTNLIAPGSPGKAIGSVDSGNSVVPFTVEVLSLKVVGNQTILSLAFTNGGSGELDATRQFIGSVSDIGDPLQISGVYLEDPASKQRFEVTRPSQTQALCSRIDPAFGAGERRTLEARFAAIPVGVKSVYVYFPHAAPITDVAVTR